jgi:hypothetical protein
MIGMAIITQVANSVLRTGILGMGLPGDGYGYEGRIQARFTQVLKWVVIAIFTTNLEFSGAWQTSFKSRRVVPMMALQLGRRCPVSSGGFEDHDPFIDS